MQATVFRRNQRRRSTFQSSDMRFHRSVPIIGHLLPASGPSLGTGGSFKLVPDSWEVFCYSVEKGAPARPCGCAFNWKSEVVRYSPQALPLRLRNMFSKACRKTLRAEFFAWKPFISIKPLLLSRASFEFFSLWGVGRGTLFRSCARAI